MLNKDILIQIFRKLLDEAKKAHDELNAIDGKIGDGDLGITIDIEKDFPHGFYFGEDQSRYLLEIKEKNYDQIKYVANSYNVFFEKLGIIGGDSIKIKNVGEKKVSELRDNFELGVGAITFNE